MTELLSIYKKIILAICIFIVSLTSISLLFSNIGAYGFVEVTVKVFTIVGSAWSAFYLFRLFRANTKIVINRVDVVTLAIIISFSLLNLFFHHELLLGDYDAGRYALKAIEFPIHFQNSYYNFEPYRFAAYTVLLSIPSILFNGLSLYLINPILLFLSLSLIYFTSLELTNSRLAGFFSVLMVGISYPVVWFFRETLATDLWFFFFFFCVYLFLRLIKTKNIYFFFLSILTCSLALVTRIEAIILFLAIPALTVCYVIFRKITISEFSRYINDNKKTAFVFSIIMILITINFFNYYWLLFPQGQYEYTIAPFIKAFKNTFASSSFELTKVTYNTSPPTYKDYLWRYVADSLQSYGLLFFVFGTLIVFIKIIVAQLKRKRLNKELSYLAFFLIVGAYLTAFAIEPATSFTQPWFLRHFLVPISGLIVLFVCGLCRQEIFPKKYTVTIFVVLTLILGIKSFPIVFFSEYKGSYEVLSSLSEPLNDSEFDETVLISTNEYNKNYGTALRIMAYLPWEQFYGKNSLYDISDPSLITQYSQVYILSSRDIREADISVLAGLDLDLIKHETLETTRLVYPSPQRYAQNWLMPPAHLEYGYGPFLDVVWDLPPSEKFNASYSFYLFKAVKSQ